MSEDNFHLEIDGFCPICEKNTLFVAKNRWLRGALNCTSCEGGSVPRERALAYALNREAPNWRDLNIHESSPAKRGISVKLRAQCKNYIGSHYFAGKKPGSIVEEYRNENIEAQTFADSSFDIAVTLDVMEHVFSPGSMIQEIYRTLKPGGLYISTFPIKKEQIESHIRRAVLNENKEIVHLVETPEYHGNPINNEGALVTVDYGYTIHQMIPHWAPFEVEITRYHINHMAILGEYTEVILCRKPPLKTLNQST